jgi:hypothetical protein
LDYPDLDGVRHFINVSGLGKRTPVTATSKYGGKDRVIYVDPPPPSYPLNLEGRWIRPPKPPTARRIR